MLTIYLHTALFLCKAKQAKLALPYLQGALSEANRLGDKRVAGLVLAAMSYARR